jgi:hypothetical protein
MRKRKLHLTLNWVLYVICQILGWRIIGFSGEQWWIVCTSVFLYSFLMTSIYTINKEIIVEFYDGIEHE